MSCTSVANIRIEPVDVYWQIEEQECWDFTNATAAGFGGKYVTAYNAAGDGFYFWGDENNTDVDPAPGGGLTGVSVEYGAGATAAAIATAFAAAIGGTTGFDATADGLIVTSVRTAVGSATDSTEGDAGAFISLTKTQDGKDVYLGLLSGDVVVTTEEATLELVAHQTGTTVRADLRQGVNATVALTIQESDNGLRKSLYTGSAGGSFTPGGGTEVFGWGSLKQGLSTITDAARLIMHPVALDAADKSRDLCFWKSYPLISTLTFSGENPETMEVEFKCYLDDHKPEGVNLFAFGDHTQSGITA